jgi:hypothetical protein
MKPNGPRSVWLILLVAVLGVGIGYCVARKPVPGPTYPPVSLSPTPIGDVTISVGPTACDVMPPKATIGPWDHVFWRGSGTSLRIIFKRSGFPAGVSTPPFDGMLASGNDFAVRCTGNTCTSGPVNPNLPHTGSYEYKYDQILDGQSCDARIVIKW